MDNEKIVIVDGARTPVGSFGGTLKDVPAHELGAIAARAAIRRSGVEADDLEAVVMGCIGQVGPDAYNARRVALAAGLSERTPALTVNRLCGSGLQALWSAAMEMSWNRLDFALAGGDESMSRMPFYDFDARNGHKLGDRTLVDGTVAMLTDPFQRRTHGDHRRERRPQVLRFSRRAGRVRGRVAAPSVNRTGTGCLRSGDRAGRRRRTQPSRGDRGRASQARHHARVACAASPGVRPRRHRDGRQLLGHQRWRRRAGAGPAVGRAGAGASTRSSAWRPSRRRRWNPS